MSRSAKANRATQLANKYTHAKIDEVWKKLEEIEQFGQISSLKIKELIGREMALAYGLGWIAGTEKRTLYMANGEELT